MPNATFAFRELQVADQACRGSGRLYWPEDSIRASLKITWTIERDRLGGRSVRDGRTCPCTRIPRLLAYFFVKPCRTIPLYGTMNVPVCLHWSPAASHFSLLSDCATALCRQRTTAQLQLSAAATDGEAMAMRNKSRGRKRRTARMVFITNPDRKVSISLGRGGRSMP